MNQIDQCMRELRKSIHLSQADIAKLCGSKSIIRKTKKGLTVLSVKLFVWYADYFDISMDYLCCRTDQPQGKLYERKPQLKYSDKDMRQFIEMCFDPSSPYNGKLKEVLFQRIDTRFFQKASGNYNGIIYIHGVLSDFGRHVCFFHSKNPPFYSNV